MPLIDGQVDRALHQFAAITGAVVLQLGYLQVVERVNVRGASQQAARKSRVVLQQSGASGHGEQHLFGVLADSACNCAYYTCAQLTEKLAFASGTLSRRISTVNSVLKQPDGCLNIKEEINNDEYL